MGLSVKPLSKLLVFVFFSMMCRDSSTFLFMRWCSSTTTFGVSQFTWWSLSQACTATPLFVSFLTAYLYSSTSQFRIGQVQNGLLYVRYRSSSQEKGRRAVPKAQRLLPFPTVMLNLLYQFCSPLTESRRIKMKISILFIFFLCFFLAWRTSKC